MTFITDAETGYREAAAPIFLLNSVLTYPVRILDGPDQTELFIVDSSGPGLVHCAIPCGIDCPGPSGLAAVAVVRLMDIADGGASDDQVALANLRARCTLRKEEEAEKVRQEIRVIWGD